MKNLVYKSKKAAALLLSLLLLLGGCGGESFDTDFTAFGTSADTALTQVLSTLETARIEQTADRLASYRQSETQGHLLSGTAAADSAAEAIAEMMKESGLKEVAFEEFSCDTVNLRSASVSYVSGETPVTCSLGVYPTLTVGVGASGSYELVYAGDGSAEEYRELSVTGKAVLIICDTSDGNVLNAAVETAEKAGAAAVLAASPFEKGREPVLSSGILSGAVRIPVFSMTAEDASELKEAWDNALEKVTTKYKKGKKTYTEVTYVRKPVYLSFNVDYTVASGQTGRNVTGMIPGADDSQAIVIGAAYDHWYEGYNGSLTAVGLLLELARAMNQCGYVPQKTVIFTAYGGSVYGRHNAPYALHNGLQAQLAANAKAGRETVYALYVNAPSLDLGDALPLSVSVGMKDAVEQLLADMISPAYEEGVAVRHIDTASEGQFLYGEHGIGTAGITLSQAGISDLLGTDADTAERFDADALAFAAQVYARLLLGLDSTALRPIGVIAYFNDAVGALERLQLTDDGATAALIKSVSLLEASVNNINSRYRMALASGNEDTVRTIGEQSAAVNVGLKQFAQRIAQHCSIADADRNLLYWFEPQARLTEAVEASVKELQLNDIDDALELLSDVGTAGLSADFGAKLGSDIAARVEKGDRKELTYLFNRIRSQPDLCALTASLAAAEASGGKDADVSQQLAQLRDIASEQREELTQALGAWKTAVGICCTQVEKMAELFIPLHDYM